ncbi:hypothetical protein GDO81_021095 [Engystomops pustulosus]|uniref:Uncharacterized protein n=1 Tax=Engystomops pustulosus TaxID=76066 RepID=A0AAV6ZD16_ENGPU|nr:hypothetical protein GDO81_021095 [Engystomops pustulosus]
MLSEAFLRTAIYRGRVGAKEQEEGEKNSGVMCTGRAPSGGREHALRHSELSGAATSALCIPRHEALSYASLDLYTSWSSRCGSIYKNYPDLHIAGDHVLHKMVDSGCILDGDCEDGPVLVSMDIDSRSLPGENAGGLLEHEEEPRSTESHILPCAPISNSVLNDFIEKKMQEVYKQCYEEKLTAGGSLHPGLWSAVLHHVSLHISQEQNIKDPALQCLCSTTGGSSEFITPVLHISSQDSKAKARPPPNTPPHQAEQGVTLQHHRSTLVTSRAAACTTRSGAAAP